MTVHYIYNNVRIENKIKEYFERQEIKAVLYDMKTLESVDVLLLINPCKVGDMYYDMHLLWQAYLRVKAPNTKLIICNMNEKSNLHNHNYLCITDFPNDFNTTIKNAVTVKDLTRIEAINLSIRKQLESYFKGHHHSSLFQKFNYLEMTIKNINYTIDDEIDRTFQEAKDSLFELAKEQLENFDVRWKFYLRFFKYSPFKPNRDKIIRNLKVVTEYFNNPLIQTEEEFVEREIPKMLREIRACLNEMEKYVIAKIN